MTVKCDNTETSITDNLLEVILVSGCFNLEVLESKDVGSLYISCNGCIHVVKASLPRLSLLLPLRDLRSASLGSRWGATPLTTHPEGSQVFVSLVVRGRRWGGSGRS